MEENRLPLYVGGGAAGGGAGRADHVLRRAASCARGAASGPGRRPGPRTRSRWSGWIGWARYGFLEDADNRPFYFAVSEVIRDYLGARYGFDSLEMTTDELVAELQAPRGPRAGASWARSRAGCRPATW